MKVCEHIRDAFDDFNRFPFHHWYGDLRMIVHDGIAPIEQDGGVTERFFCPQMMITFSIVLVNIHAEDGVGSKDVRKIGVRILTSLTVAGYPSTLAQALRSQPALPQSINARFERTECDLTNIFMRIYFVVAD